MPDHFFDELDRDEIDLFGDEDAGYVREALKDWLGYAPSPLQIAVSEQYTEQLRGIAEAIGHRIETRNLYEGRSLVSRTVLINPRGQVVVRGAERVRQWLEEEVSF